jgi:hypothetical protein
VQDSDTKRVPTGAADLQKCIAPFAILILKPAFRADLSMSGDGPALTWPADKAVGLFAAGCELGVDE